MTNFFIYHKKKETEYRTTNQENKTRKSDKGFK